MLCFTSVNAFHKEIPMNSDTHSSLMIDLFSILGTSILESFVWNPMELCTKMIFTDSAQLTFSHYCVVLTNDIHSFVS